MSVTSPIVFILFTAIITREVMGARFDERRDFHPKSKKEKYKLSTSTPFRPKYTRLEVDNERDYRGSRTVDIIESNEGNKNILKIGNNNIKTTTMNSFAKENKADRQNRFPDDKKTDVKQRKKGHVFQLQNAKDNPDDTPKIETDPPNNAFPASENPVGNNKRNRKHKKLKTNTDLRQNDNSTETIKTKTAKVTNISIHDTMEKMTQVNASEFDDDFKSRSMYVEPRFVKDDPRIKEFTKHVYEQSIKVLESIKAKMVSYELKKEVDHIMRSYEEKFGDFVRETQKHKIRTRLGRKKVILNTVDTSNRILERLVNYLIGKMDEKGILRNERSENVLRSELNKKIDLENKHICSKLAICRTRESFTTFLINIFTIVLASNDRKVKQATDASTEVLRNTDFSRVMTPDTERRLRIGLDNIDRYTVAVLRPIYFILKNIVHYKNSPIEVVGPEDSRVNKTMAFLEILELWDKKLPPDDSNVLEWYDIGNSFKDWSEDKRTDILELVQGLVDHIMKAVNKFDEEDSKNFGRKIDIIMGY